MNVPISGHGTEVLDSEHELDEIFEQISGRLRRGDDFDLEAIISAYPQFADRLRAVVPGMRAMIELGHMPAGTVESSEEAGDSAHSGILGDFRIIREIGRGGMGVVYEGEQISLSRRVALKVLPFAAMLDDKSLQRFKNEARAAATVNHQNIVPIYSVGVERGVHYYAMQMIDGQSLAEVISDLRLEAGGEKLENSGGSVVSSKSSVAKGRRPTNNQQLTTNTTSNSQIPDSKSQIDTSPVAHLSTVRSGHPRESFHGLSFFSIGRTDWHSSG